MAHAGRRTAGTQTFLDGFRRLVGHRPTPEEDLADLRAGHTLLVGAFRHEGRWRQGQFVLDVDGDVPLAWQRWPRGAAEPLGDGAWVRPAGPDTPRYVDRRFVSVTVGSEQGINAYAVPAKDLPVVEEAFRIAGAGRPDGA